MNTASDAPLIKNQDQKLLDSVPMNNVDPEESEILRMEKEAETKKANRAALFKQLWMFGLMIVIDIGLPLAIYYILENFVSQLIALLLSGIPPLLHVIINFIRKRRIEVIGCICIFSFVLSGILTIISGNARIALLRDSTTTAVISLAFFVTLIPLRTPWFKLYPLTFLIYQQMTSEMPPLEWTDYDGQRQALPRPLFFWEHFHYFRRQNYITTLIWAVALMTEFVVKVIMITATSLSVDIIMLSGMIVMLVLTVASATAVIIITRRTRKRCVVFLDDWLKTNDYSSSYKSRGSDNSV